MGIHKISDEHLAEFKKLCEGYDLSPLGIIKNLDLQRPIYEQTATYGHFGHQDFSWER